MKEVLLLLGSLLEVEVVLARVQVVELGHLEKHEVKERMIREYSAFPWIRRITSLQGDSNFA